MFGAMAFDIRKITGIRTDGSTGELNAQRNEEPNSPQNSICH